MRHDMETRRLARLVRGDGGLLAGADAPEAVPGLGVYRRLILERSVSAFEMTLPRTARLLGRQRLSHWVAAFLADRGALSPYFRDLGGEVLRWCLAKNLQAPELPAFWRDAATFELVCFEVLTSPRNPEGTALPLQLDLPLRWTAASALLRCSWSVHEAREGSGVRERPSNLLVYRDPRTKRVLHLVLTEAAMQILQRLSIGEALGAGIRAGLMAANVECTDAVLSEVSAMLADMAQRGVILGAACMSSGGPGSS